MNQLVGLAVVWGLGVLVAVAGGALESLLITAVGLLSVALALGGVVTVWRSDLLNRPRSVAGRPDSLED